MGHLSDKTFLGGLDQDSDPRMVARTDIVDALNVRFGFTDRDSEGTLENIRGNQSFNVPFPAEVTNNRCVGAFENIDTQKIYFFTISYDNVNGSCIFEFDRIQNLVTLVLSDATINGFPSLNFDERYLINHVDVIDGVLLYWTDGFNPPRKINIERAKSNGYPIPFVEQYVDAIQYAPAIVPTAKYGSDPTRKSNDLRQKLFQFSYSYIYLDKEESPTSPFSKLIIPVGTGLPTTENLSVVPPGVATTPAPDVLEKNNYIDVSVNTGTAYVEKINIYTRIGNTNDWYLVDTLDKQNLGIPDNATYVYRFYNDRVLLSTDQELANRGFDEVPLLANAQAFIDGNRLAYGGITEGYDNIVPDVAVNPIYNPSFFPTERTFLPVKTLKRNSDFAVGLVYYDAAGRSTFVQSNENMVFHVLSDFETINNRGAVGLDLGISHTVPTEFVAYEVVLTESLTIDTFITFTCAQGRIFAPASGPNADKLIISLLDIPIFRSVTTTTALDYSFIPGDRVRLRYGPGGSFIPDGTRYSALTEPFDIEIRNFVTEFDLGGSGGVRVEPAITVTRNETIYDIFFGGPFVGFGGDTRCTFEIYRPRLTQTENQYFTIGERFPILNGFHTGITENGSFTLQTASNPALVQLRGIGDTYLRFRYPFQNIPGKAHGPTIEWPIMECPDFSDYYESMWWDRGRANVVDENQGQMFRPTTIRYSEPFVFDTNINGLSTFVNASFRDYDQRWGIIRRLYAENKRLIMFQQLKVSQILVNENILFDSDNTPTGTVGQQTIVLNNNTYYAGEFGIGDNPESFAVYGNVKYFVDVPRGAVLRLSQDGITRISDYKMHNFFTRTLSDVNNIIEFYNVLGVFDTRFDEYVLAISSRNQNPNSILPPPPSLVTIGFSERKNRWISRYSYEPGIMVQSGIDIVTFKAGIPYLHNASSIYNNFYGVTTAHSFTYIVNDAAQYMKSWQNMIFKSLQPMGVEVTNENGQDSIINESDFVVRQGRFYASFYRDQNTPNVGNALIEGDQLRSDYLRIELTKQTDITDFHKVFMITVQFRGSYILK